jgi:hypothetical protein
MSTLYPAAFRVCVWVDEWIDEENPAFLRMTARMPDNESSQAPIKVTDYEPPVWGIALKISQNSYRKDSGSKANCSTHQGYASISETPQYPENDSEGTVNMFGTYSRKPLSGVSRTRTICISHEYLPDWCIWQLGQTYTRPFSQS